MKLEITPDNLQQGLAGQEPEHLRWIQRQRPDVHGGSTLECTGRRAAVAGCGAPDENMSRHVPAQSRIGTRSSLDGT